MQGRNGDADVENGLADTVGEGEGGMNGESRISIYTGLCVKWRSAEKLPCGTGSLAPFSVMTLRGGMGEGRETQGGGDICLIMADLICCMAETNTTL